MDKGKLAEEVLLALTHLAKDSETPAIFMSRLAMAAQAAALARTGTDEQLHQAIEAARIHIEVEEEATQPKAEA